MTECHLYAGPHLPRINPNLAIKQGPVQRCWRRVIDILRCMSFVYVATPSQGLSPRMTSRPSLHTPLDSGALHEWLLSSPWLYGISAEDISVKITSGVKRLGRCRRQLEVVCPAHWFHHDPVALCTYWSISPRAQPNAHSTSGDGTQASAWPSVQQTNGTYSIVCCTSLYETLISEVVQTKVHLGYWDCVNRGRGELINLRAYWNSRWP